MVESWLFTSESVTEGHPDKVCDQISDGILDECLKQDSFSKVAVETAVKDNNVYIIGELSTKARLDAVQVAKKTIKKIGYVDELLGFDCYTCKVSVRLSQQSQDISQGINLENKEIGAGDQGMMFGYADKQTRELMPLPISLAHKLAKKLTAVRKSGAVPYLRPDGKAQVTVKYKNGKPDSVTTVVLSAQHSDKVSMRTLRGDLRGAVIEQVIPKNLLTKQVKIHINPTGRFVIGGPVGDSGVTGRKIIVDTYGGWSRHGGGCFSGKDPTKVDRSAAYAARQAAKSVIKAGLAEKCEIQLAYAIGVAQPVSIHLTTFGTGKIPDGDIKKIVQQIDFRPAAIIARLELRQPIYQKTASYGHFGRIGFPWEKPLKINL